MKEKWIVEKKYNELWNEKFDSIAKYKSKVFKIPTFETGDLYSEIYLYGYDKYMQADENTRCKFENKSYFSAIAHNMLIDLARKYKGRMYTDGEKIIEGPLEYETGDEIPIPDETVSIEYEIIRREQRRLLHEAIDRLEKQEDKIFVNGILVGKTYKELAEELDCTVNNIGVKKTRIVEKLKDIISEIEKNRVKDVVGAGIGIASGGIVSPGIFGSVLANVGKKVLVAGILDTVKQFFIKRPKTSVLHLVEDLLENY